MGGLWVLGTPILDNFLTLVQNGDALQNGDLGMGVFLDSPFLVKERVAAMARKTFV